MSEERKITMKEGLSIIAIVFAVCLMILILSAMLAQFWIRTFDRMRSGVTTYEITVSYGWGRKNENITVPANTTFEGVIFPIRFDLYSNYTYQFIRSINKVDFGEEYDIISYYDTEFLQTFIVNDTAKIHWISFKQTGFFGLLRLEGIDQKFVGAVYASKV